MEVSLTACFGQTRSMRMCSWNSFGIPKMEICGWGCCAYDTVLELYTAESTELGFA